MNANERNRMDQWLGRALSQYGEAEPRRGLENRVLANLRGEREKASVRHRWWWSAGALATVAMVTAVWLGSRSGVTTRTPHVASTPVPQVASPGAVGAAGVPPSQAAIRSPRKALRIAGARTTAQSPAPKLEQFPSPAPLSEQEQLLAQYVAQHHQHAVVLARAQTELLKKERAEELLQGTKPENSYQPED